MNQILSLLSKVDVVGVQLKPTLRGNSRVKSAFGGLLSLIIIGCILFGFIFFGISIIKKDTPIMNLVQRKEDFAVVPLRESPLILTLHDQAGTLLNIDPKFMEGIELEATMTIVRPLEAEEGQTFTNVQYFGKMDACRESMLGERIVDYVKTTTVPFENFLCVNPDSFYNAEGEKYEGTVEIINNCGQLFANCITLDMKFCDEKAKPGCRDYTNSFGEITVLFSNYFYFLDQTNYEDPVKIDYTINRYTLSDKFKQSIFSITKIHEIVTDSSLFLTDEKTETYYSPDNIYSSIKEYSENNRIAVSFTIGNSQTLDVNQRRYLKIPELLANMGGFIKAAMLIGQMLAYLYSDYVYYVTVKKIEQKTQNRFKVNNFVQLNDKSSQKAVLNAPDDKSNSHITFNKTSVPQRLFGFYQFVKNSVFSSSKDKPLQTYDQYLELDYIIDKLLFIEQLNKDNNS